MQGYGALSDSERRSLWLGPRFSPLLCFAGIAGSSEGKIVGRYLTSFVAGLRAQPESVASSSVS